MKIIDKFDGYYYFLSNFFERDFIWENNIWKTSEHAFQAAKTSNKEQLEAIRDSDSPGAAKKLGRTCDLRPYWELVKVDFMRSIILAKFRDRDLKQGLLETRDAYIIEGNTWSDTFWGFDFNKKQGENWLGRILMETRDKYRYDQDD